MKLFTTITTYCGLLVAGGATKRDIATLVLGILSAIASGVPFPLIGIVFGQLLNDFNQATCEQDDAIPASYQDSVNQKILLIFYLAIAQFVLIYCHLCCWSLGGARLAQRLREQYLRSLLKQEPLYFSKFPPGEVSARLNGDIQTIRSGTSEKVGIVLASLSFFVTAYIVAFIKDYKLSAELLSLVPAFLLMSFVGSHYVEKYAGIMSDASASAASIALEALSNMVLVQSFRANARLEKRFAQALEIAEAQGIRKAFATGVQAGVLYFVAYSANALAFWQGSVRIASSINEPGTDANVGSVFTVVFVLIEATLLMSQVAPFLHIFASAVASYRKLQEELFRESLIQDSKQAQVLSDRPLKGSFEFRNVTFRYPARPDVTVVDGISLTVEARKHTAIVGLSGSGKSTLVGLMLRLFDAMDGTVYLDGHDVRDLRLEDVRRTSSVVPQNAALLDRSLLENIAYGLISSSHSEHHALLPTLLGPRLGILAEELREGKEIGAAALAHGQEIAEIVKLVRDAAIMADADSFISAMGHGYGTLAGPGGQSISGGQKQRVALARALVKDPAVLILDEATASLDSVSEVKIQNAIALASSGRTTLTIAHRLSTIRNADKIVVMHAGKVVEHGSHAELLSHNGRYAELVRLQTMSSTTPGQDDVLTPKRQMNSTEGAQKKAELQVREDAVVDPSQSKPPSVNGTHEFPGSFAKLFARTFWPVLRPHLLMTALAFASAVIVGATFSGEAVIFGNTVGALSPCNPVSSIEASGRFFGLMFFILALIEFFASIISWSGFGFVSSKSVRALRSTLFNSMLDQDLAWHQKKGTSPAGLLSYITRDCEAWAGLSGSVIGTICSITLNLLAAIIMTHIIAWRIALVTLSLVPLLLGSGLMELRVLGRFEEKHETAYSSSVEIGVESVTNINVIATFSLEQLTMQTYSRSLAGPKKETLRVTLQASFWQATMYFLGNCINALAYWWGSKQIATGNYTQVQFLIVVFSLLVGALLWAQMFALAPELTSAKAAIMRIARIMSIAREGQATDALIRTGSGSDSDIEAKAESKGTPKGVSGPAGVRFHDVQFAYPARPDSQVLHGLNITICPGQLCALVGPSGAGKSTIIQLVLGLYRPQTGSVWIDGTCLTNRADVTFRDRFAIVPQENTLFEGTVAFNIGLGARPDEVADQDEIEHACKLAGIHETIMNLPDKYDTLCGTNGNQFSGGQRQRLSIARALVRQPDLLILDEPSSALDAESEKLLQQSLEIVAKTATVIVIAHRLHTIRSADVIFMIENGQCTARGTHEELLQSSPAYRTNVMHQMVAHPDS